MNERVHMNMKSIATIHMLWLKMMVLYFQAMLSRSEERIKCKWP